MAEINKNLDAKLQSHDTEQALLVVSYATRSELTNPAGVVNGGIVSTMLDITMGRLVVAQTGGKKIPVSLDLHTSFFKPVLSGPRCIVEARIEKLGRSVVYTNAVAVSESGETLAKAIHTAQLADLQK
ncbi:MAG: PaaI family thioesterase [Myxococcota bacterium]